MKTEIIAAVLMPPIIFNTPVRRLLQPCRSKQKVCAFASIKLARQETTLKTINRVSK